MKRNLWFLYIAAPGLLLFFLKGLAAQIVSTVETGATFETVASPLDQARWNFAMGLWRLSIVANSQSAVLCPVLTALLLTIAHLGSSGDTRAEILKSFPFTSSSESNVTAEQLMDSWKTDFRDALACNDEHFFCIQNVHLLKKNAEVTLKDSFVEKLNTLLNGKLSVENYDDYLANAMDRANQETRKKNERIVGGMKFSGDSFTILINATFNDQPWLNKFAPEKTINRDFGTDRKNVIQLPFMPGEVFTTYFFGDNEDVQIIGMPFSKDDTTRMYIFLPLNKQGLGNFELETNGDQLLQMILKLKKEEVEVEALKFETETAQDLTEGLKRLPLAKIFSEDADFSEMTESKIHIEKFNHTTFIKIDEDGFESEEIHSTTKRPVSKVLWQGPHYRFVAYHPFLYVIAKNQADLLYIGHYM